MHEKSMEGKKTGYFLVNDYWADLIMEGLFKAIKEVAKNSPDENNVKAIKKLAELCEEFTIESLNETDKIIRSQRERQQGGSSE